MFHSLSGNDTLIAMTTFPSTIQSIHNAVFGFSMITHVFLCLNLFTYVYPYLLVFTYFYTYLPMITPVYSCYLCLPLFSRACLPMITPVYSCLPMFTYV